ncbi:hypothetical protein BN844_2912 [Pseudomonas sp. SHC52]|nr:hypothetical protein BN844_2912 [Pseudomonas sp. SHC52]
MKRNKPRTLSEAPMCWKSSGNTVTGFEKIHVGKSAFSIGGGTLFLRPLLKRFFWRIRILKDSAVLPCNLM